MANFHQLVLHLMNDLSNLENVEIEDGFSTNVTINADSKSLRFVVTSFLIFIFFGIAICVFSYFGPPQIARLTTNIELQGDILGDTFSSILSNISPLNQFVRITMFYPFEENSLLYFANLSVLLIKDNIAINSEHGYFSMKLNQPKTVFQISLVDFDQLIFNVTLSTNYNEKHNATVMFDYVPCDGSFFQIKVRIIFSIISLTLFVYAVMNLKSFSQFFTTTIYMTPLLLFNPFYIIYYFYPNQILAVTDFVLKKAGYAYIYFFCQAIFFIFEKHINYTAILIQGIISFIFLIFLFSSEFSTFMTIEPTFQPPDDYRTMKFLLILLCFLIPIIISSLYSAFKLKEMTVRRACILSISIFLVFIFFWESLLLNVLKGFFRNTSLEWISPYTAILLLTIMIQFWNLEEEHDLNYTKASELVPSDDEPNDLGIETDENQLSKNTK